jgi:hypothetical protein
VCARRPRRRFAGSNEGMLAVADHLIGKVRAGKG